MKRTWLIAIMIPSFCFAAPPKKKTTFLSRAILDANRLMKTIEQADEHAKQIIVDAGTMKGEFSALVDIDKISVNDDGETEIDGKVEVKHPDRERYRTPDERAKIAELNAAIDGAKKEAPIRIAEEQAKFKAKWPSKPIGANKHYTEDKVNLDRTIRELKQRQRNAVASTTKARNDYIKSIKGVEQERRELCELLSCTIVVPEKLASKLDTPAMLKKKRVKMTVSVREFDLGREPDEIGGAICVQVLTLRMEKLPKR